MVVELELELELVQIAEQVPLVIVDMVAPMVHQLLRMSESNP